MNHNKRGTIESVAFDEISYQRIGCGEIEVGAHRARGGPGGNTATHKERNSHDKCSSVPPHDPVLLSR